MGAYGDWLQEIYDEVNLLDACLLCQAIDNVERGEQGCVDQLDRNHTAQAIRKQNLADREAE